MVLIASLRNTPKTSATKVFAEYYFDRTCDLVQLCRLTKFCGVSDKNPCLLKVKMPMLVTYSVSHASATRGIDGVLLQVLDCIHIRHICVRSVELTLFATTARYE